MDKSIYNVKSITAAKRRKRSKDNWDRTLKKAARMLGMDEYNQDRVYVKARAAIGWDWQDKPGQRRKAIRYYVKTASKGFYTSREWRELRYKALNKYGKRCSCCGATPETAILHVDHIKPRSTHPDLELDIDNLQVLCEDCNLGKSNKDTIKHR